MATPVDLTSPSALPAALVSRLAPLRRLFQKANFLDQVLSHEEIAAIEHELENWLQSQQILGWHCTRLGQPERLARQGLRPTSIDQHQTEFLEEHGRHFNPSEKAAMKNEWRRYFGVGQKKGREGLVWAALTHGDLLGDGCAPFFEYCGGEAVYFPLRGHPTIADKLRTLGTPVVVELALPGNSLTAYSSMSKAVLSRYHRRINPDAQVYESEAILRQAIPPERVLRVISKDVFFEEAARKR